MESALQKFEKRQRQLKRKHVRMARGYVTKMDKSGIIVQRPDNKVGGAVFKLLFLACLAFFAFKVFVLAGLGTEPYLERVSQLGLGNGIEQAGAWLMQIDPLTGFLADLLAPYLS